MHLKRNATSMNTLFKYVWQKSASWSNLFKYLICSNSQHFGLRISLASIWPLLACYYAQMVKWLPWKGTGPKGSIPRAGRIFQLWTLFSRGHQNRALCSILWQLGGCHFFFPLHETWYTLRIFTTLLNNAEFLCLVYCRNSVFKIYHSDLGYLSKFFWDIL